MLLEGLQGELLRRWRSSYGIVITLVEAVILVWIGFVLLSTRWDKQCADLHLYMELTAVYYGTSFAATCCVMLCRGIHLRWLELPLILVLVAGYVLVGWGLFVVALAYKFCRDACDPKLLYTALFVSTFRTLHTNIVECDVVLNFFNVDALRWRDDRIPRWASARERPPLTPWLGQREPHRDGSGVLEEALLPVPRLAPVAAVLPQPPVGVAEATSDTSMDVEALA